MNQTTPIAIEVEAKPWWESRAMWVNIIGFLVLALGIVLDASGTLGLSARFVAYLGLAVTLLNAWIRWSTSQPISAKRGDTAVMTVEANPATLPISTRMLHEENVDLAEKLNSLDTKVGAVDNYIRDLRADLAVSRVEPEPEHLGLGRDLPTRSDPHG